MFMKKLTKRLLYASFIVVLIVVAACGVIAYSILYMPNFTSFETKYIYVYEGEKNFELLCEELVDSVGCDNIKLFKLLAGFRKYPENMKSGRFAVEPGMKNIDLLNRLRRGQQAPVRLTFNNIRLISDLTDRLSGQLMISNDDLL